MQSVKIRTQTNYKGKTLRPGNVVGVPDEVASRWSSRNIAHPTDESATAGVIGVIDEKVTPPVAHEGDNGGGSNDGGGNQDGDKSPYDGMKPKELYDLCAKKGLEVEARKGAAYYIEKLTSAEAGADQ